MHLKILGTFEAFLCFPIINSLLQLVHDNRANIDTHNFANCFILIYSISTLTLNISVGALPWTKNGDGDIEWDEFCIKDGLGTILEEGNVYDNYLS
jgi:hypothetical protein